MSFRKVMFFIPIFFITDSLAQQEQAEVVIEDLVEQIAEALGEEYDYGQIADRLIFYHRFPIDLNETQGKELRELYFLSPLQIEHLLDYRKIAGKFISLYEIQSIDGFDFLTIQRLLPFVTISEKRSFKDFTFKDGKHDVMVRYGRALQLSEGYLRSKDSGKSRYLGNPDRYLIRYRYQIPKRIQIAINMKKDAGEQFFYGTQKHGFDFYSASIHVLDIGKVKNLVIGDYSLQFGQGLSLWSGLSFGKGSLLQNVARQGLGIKPYTSTNEALFFRGISGVVKFDRLEITPFFSYRKLDASINHEENTFSSLSSSGYNRTAIEQSNRRSVDQLAYGVDLKYKFDKLNLGVNVHQTSFNRKLVPAQRLYNQFNFSGDQMINASLYYDYTFHGTYVFGEVAHRLNGGFATVNGLISSISHDLSLVLLHRSYQKTYFSFYNQAFSENSDAKNETGFYSGLQWAPNHMTVWTIYADYFKFPWLKFRVDAPSNGYDLFSFFGYSPNKTAQVSIRYRLRRKQENSTLESPVNILSNVFRQQLRLEMKYPWTASVSFRSRFELSSYQKENEQNETGLMFYQDLLYKPLSSAISGNIRFAFFNTDSYNSRIYAYENDVLYGYSFPAYANRGIRFYGNIRYKLNRKTDVWFRYASFLFNESGIGSGLDEISGKTKSDIRLQLRVQI